MKTETTELVIVEEDPRKGVPSASGIERIVLCRGSWIAEQQCMPEATSKDAAAGTRMHQYMELGSSSSDEDENEALEWCRKTELDLAQALLSDGYTSSREMRLWLKDDDDDDDDEVMSGQADIVYSDNDKALVIDYKFGRGEVTTSPKNKQLLALAVLVYVNSPSPLQDVYCAILQPYLSRQKPELVRYSASQLEAAKPQLIALIDQAANPMQPLKASAKACKYCRAAATCLQLRTSLSTVANEETGLRWERSSPAQKKEILDLSSLAKSWADKVQKLAKADLAQGLSIDGYSLTKGRCSFKVTDASAAFMKLSESISMSPADFAACCSVGISKLDKAVHDARKATLGKVTTTESKDWLRSTLADCGEVSTTDGSIKAIKS